jgi:hypothetical protein
MTALRIQEAYRAIFPLEWHGEYIRPTLGLAMFALSESSANR